MGHQQFSVMPAFGATPTTPGNGQYQDLVVPGNKLANPDELLAYSHDDLLAWTRQPENSKNLVANYTEQLRLLRESVKGLPETKDRPPESRQAADKILKKYEEVETLHKTPYTRLNDEFVLICECRALIKASRLADPKVPTGPGTPSLPLPPAAVKDKDTEIQELKAQLERITQRALDAEQFRYEIDPIPVKQGSLIGIHANHAIEITSEPYIQDRDRKNQPGFVKREPYEESRITVTEYHADPKDNVEKTLIITPAGKIYAPEGFEGNLLIKLPPIPGVPPDKQPPPYKLKCKIEPGTPPFAK
jgi:hypothetical protein